MNIITMLLKFSVHIYEIQFHTETAADTQITNSEIIAEFQKKNHILIIHKYPKKYHHLLTSRSIVPESAVHYLLKIL